MYFYASSIFFSSHHPPLLHPSPQNKSEFSAYMEISPHNRQQPLDHFAEVTQNEVLSNIQTLSIENETKSRPSIPPKPPQTKTRRADVNQSEFSKMHELDTHYLETHRYSYMDLRTIDELKKSRNQDPLFADIRNFKGKFDR